MILETVSVAFSMFSRIPMPRLDWNERNMRYMLCAFPLVGAVIGGLLCLWVLLCNALGFGKLLYAAGITLLPVLVTGGIHLDGLCDVSDALASHAPPEKRREILKDPHAGAFAVISCCAYMLLYFALTSETEPEIKTALLLGFAHFLSRGMSGLCVICYPASASRGLASGFKDAALKKRAAALLVAEFALAAAGLIWLSWPAGAAMVFAGLLCMLILRLTSQKVFGGMSGDLAGWFLQLAEIAMLAAMVITERVTLL